MKVTTFTLLTLHLVLLLSCTENSEREVSDETNDAYTIIGNVANGEGLMVELDFPKNLGSPLLAQIEGGQFTYKGRIDRIEKARIRIQGSRIFGYTIMEPGLTVYDFDLQGSSPDYSLTMPKVLEGSNNKLFFAFASEIEEARRGRDWVFGDSLKMDSMRRLVYPDFRAQTYEILDSYIDKVPSGLKLVLVSFLTDRLDQMGAFNKSYLDKNEVTIIKKYFSKIDASYSRYQDYQRAQTAILMIDDLDLEIEFHNYQLEEIGGDVVNLSETIKNNKYTILDFWWHGCGPCRQFNKEMNADYQELKKRGVEIAAINVDRSKKDWRTASVKDNIPWSNFYAGRNTDIEMKYKISRFPTYILITDELEVVDVTFRNREDIISWMNNND